MRPRQLSVISPFLTSIAGLFVGAIGVLWRSPTWGRSGGLPPLDYTLKTQQELLASFSDAIGPRGITPRSMRDFVASTITTNPGGVPPSIPLPLPGWTTATRPTGMIGPAIGYNYDLRQLDMWDDRLGEWVNGSFGGGTVAGDTSFAGRVDFGDGVFFNNLSRQCVRANKGQVWNNGNNLSITP